MLRASLHLHCTPSRASELSDAFSSCVPRVQLITPRHRRSSVHLQCLPACDLHHLHSATVPRACLRRAHAGLEPCKGEHPPPWRQLWASVPPPPPPPPPHTHTHTTTTPPTTPPHPTHQPPPAKLAPLSASALSPSRPPPVLLSAPFLFILAPWRPAPGVWQPGNNFTGHVCPSLPPGRSACMLIVVYMLGAAMLTCIVRTSTARGSPQVGSRCCAPPVVWVASESVWCSPASTPYCPWLYARQQVPPPSSSPPAIVMSSPLLYSSAPLFLLFVLLPPPQGLPPPPAAPGGPSIPCCCVPPHVAGSWHLHCSPPSPSTPTGQATIPRLPVVFCCPPPAPAAGRGLPPGRLPGQVSCVCADVSMDGWVRGITWHPAAQPVSAQRNAVSNRARCGVRARGAADVVPPLIERHVVLLLQHKSGHHLRGLHTLMAGVLARARLLVAGLAAAGGLGAGLGAGFDAGLLAGGRRRRLALHDSGEVDGRAVSSYKPLAWWHGGAQGCRSGATGTVDVGTYRRRQAVLPPLHLALANLVLLGRLARLLLKYLQPFLSSHRLRYGKQAGRGNASRCSWRRLSVGGLRRAAAPRRGCDGASPLNEQRCGHPLHPSGTAVKEGMCGQVDSAMAAPRTCERSAGSSGMPGGGGDVESGVRAGCGDREGGVNGWPDTSAVIVRFRRSPIELSRTFAYCNACCSPSGAWRFEMGGNSGPPAARDRDELEHLEAETLALRQQHKEASRGGGPPGQWGSTHW